MGLSDWAERKRRDNAAALADRRAAAHYSKQPNDRPFGGLTVPTLESMVASDSPMLDPEKKRQAQEELDRRKPADKAERRRQRVEQTEEQRVRRYNQRMARKGQPIGQTRTYEQVQAEGQSSAGRCGKPRDGGGTCRQPKMIGKDACQYHGGK